MCDVEDMTDYNKEDKEEQNLAIKYIQNTCSMYPPNTNSQLLFSRQFFLFTL